MIQDILHCVTFADESDTPGAGAEFLSAFDYDISTWRDEESGGIRHTLYFPSKSSAEEALAFIRQNRPEWQSFGIVFSEPAYAELKKENWAESWKIHFKPLEISSRLLVCPSWEQAPKKDGQIVLTLDPGMSFGTGQHATTKFCLTAIDDITRESRSVLSMLDAGSGSGILAIAAYLFGCRPVRAFDIDPDTIPPARENADANGIPRDGIEFAVSSLDDREDGMQYDIVAANILSSALIAGREKLISLVKPGGHLILAGILDAEYERVRDAFTALGCTELRSTQEKEWRGGVFLVPRQGVPQVRD